MEKINIEKEEEKDKKNNRIIVLVLGVATVLIALIGATFAYFTAIVTYNRAPQSVTVSTVELKGVEYTATDTLTLLDAVPDNDRIETRTFSIKNPNASAMVVYDLFLVQDLNEFTLETDASGNVLVDSEGNPTSANQLVMTLSGGKLNDALQFDLTDGRTASNADTRNISLVKDVRLSALDTDEYNVSMQFLELGKPQDNNQKKSFVGHIEVNVKIETQTVSP